MTLDSSSRPTVLNTVPMAQNMTKVEGKLWETLRVLAGTEGNIYLFSTLKSLGLATNDVRNFVQKQTIHKRIEKSVDGRLKRVAMQSKLRDACAFAKRLRQDKNCLKRKILMKYRTDKAKGRRIIKDMIMRYRKLKLVEKSDADKKISLYREKNELERSLKVAPTYASELLGNVNIFSASQAEVEPQEPLGPFICDPTIKLSPNELKILSRGPKFMVREDLNNNDFDLEVEKMIVKQKYHRAFNEDDLSELSDYSKTPAPDIGSNGANQTCQGAISSKNLGEHDLNCKWQELSGQFVYNEVDKVINLGNMKATSYKHNKEVFAPQNESIDLESKHETRRVELKRAFQRIAAPLKPLNKHGKSASTSLNNPNSNSNSNLSTEE